MSFDDPDDDDDFGLVDDGDDTGLAPKFFKLKTLETTPADLQAMRVNDLIGTYIGLRNQLSTDRKSWKLREAAVKSQMLTVSMILLSKAEELGVTSFSGATGSGYCSTTEKFRVASDGWNDLCEWVRATNNFQVFQKRVTAEALREIRSAEGMPPGVERHEERTFVVRSPKK